MGTRIEKLRNYQTEEVTYPVTVAKAVYTDKGERLDQILKSAIGTAGEDYLYEDPVPRDADTLAGRGIDEIAEKTYVGSEIKKAKDTLDARIDNIISGVTSDSEVVDARTGVDGVVHTSLKERIDSEVGELKGDIGNYSLISDKADFINFKYNNMIENLGVIMELGGFNINMEDTPSLGMMRSQKFPTYGNVVIDVKRLFGEYSIYIFNEHNGLITDEWIYTNTYGIYDLGFIEGYTRIAIYRNDKTNLTADDISKISQSVFVYNVLSTNSRWNGKIINVVGDSITEGAFLNNPATERYSYLLQQKTGAYAVNNYGVSASLVSTVVNPNNPIESFVDRVRRMPTQGVSLNILFGGTNDYWTNLVEIGNVYSTDTNTFCGALNNIADYWQTNCPQSEILFVFPYSQFNGENSCRNSMGHGDFAEFRNGMKAVCEFKGIPFLDLYSESGMNLADNSVQRSIYSQEGIHLTAEGNKKIADLIYRKIEFGM